MNKKSGDISELSELNTFSTLAIKTISPRKQLERPLKQSY